MYRSVFGGLGSGITDATTDVFLESAYFSPSWIRRTARRHGLNTDASFRFERGIDPNGTLTALKRAALLIGELAGGTVSSEFMMWPLRTSLPSGSSERETYSAVDRQGDPCRHH